jgi:hypothetical protein
MYDVRYPLCFNNISFVSVLLVEETEILGENHRPVTFDQRTLSHNVVSSTPHHERDRHDITEILLKVTLSTITLAMSWIRTHNFSSGRY